LISTSTNIMAPQDFDTNTSKMNNEDLLSRVLEIVKIFEEKHYEDGKVANFLHPNEVSSALGGLEIQKSGITINETSDLVDNIWKYSIKTQHKHFYNALYHGVDTYGMTGGLLSEALNTNNYSHEVAPVFSAVERSLIQYFGSKFGWDFTDGLTTPGGSISNMYGMTLAKHFKCPELKTSGLFGSKPLVVFTSAEFHYSISKGANWLGLGLDNVVKIPTDDITGSMIPEELEKAIEDILKDGHKTPIMINATVGSTVRGGFDNLVALGKIAKKYKIWLHADCAWGGAVIFSEKYKHLMEGCEMLDSVAYNPHKMLGAPLQASIFMTRHKEILHQTNCAASTYLFQQDKFYDVTADSGDKSVQCGRKTDAFKIWFMLKVRGEDFISKRVDNAFEQAKLMETMIKKREGFRMVLEQSCTNVCFQYIPPSLRNQEEDKEWETKIDKVAPKIKEKMMKQGTLMVAYQPLPSKGLKNFFRMVFHCVPEPTEDDVVFILDEIERLGKDL